MHPDPELSAEIQRFEEQYARNPDSLVFARLADLYRKGGDPERALAILRRGLERHPDYLSAHIVRARCLQELGRREEAEEAFRDVLEMDGENLVALRGLAELARSRGDLENAERRYRQLLQVDPRNDEVRERLRTLREGDAPGEGDAPQEGGDTLREGDAPGPEVEPGGTFRLAEDEVSAGKEELPEEELPEEDGPVEPPAPPREDAYERMSPPSGLGADEPGPDPGAPEAVRETEEASDAEEAPGAEEAAAPDPTAGRPGTAPQGPGPASGAGDEPGPPEGRDGEEPDAPSATEGGLPGKEELRAHIEELRSPTGEKAGSEEVDDEDLLTETLASLYEAQGLYQEAVEVYEELLRRRPEDEALRRRLEAARAAVDAPAGEAEPEPVAPAPEADLGPEAEASPAEEEEAVSVREHLQALLRGEARVAGDGEEGP